MYIYIVSVFALGMLDALPLSFHVFFTSYAGCILPLFQLCAIHIYIHICILFPI